MLVRISLSQRLMAALGIYFVLAVMYVSTNFWTVYRSSFLVHTPLDDYIPFMPHSVYIYVFGYLLLLLYPIFFVDGKEVFSTLVRGILWITITTGLIYLVFPTSMSRPDLPVVDQTTYFLEILHKIDPPHNSFPSLHVSLATFIGVYLHKNGLLKNYPLVVALLVNLSTMLTKQHAIVDVIGGLLHSYITLRIFDNSDILSNTNT